MRSDVLLMQLIRSQWGPAIATACQGSSVPEAFLAALVANESGGNPNARRFEKSVLAALWEVLQGRTATYGSIGRSNMLDFLTTRGPSPGAAAAPDLRDFTAFALQQLDGLANSWGLTQVMGYEAIPFGIQFTDIQAPASGLKLSLRMLAQFAERFALDLGKDFSELFDCWNSGRPHVPTADPQYIPNGLVRMQLYGEG